MSSMNIRSTIDALKESLGHDKRIILLATIISVFYSASSLIGLTALVPVVALIAGQNLDQLASIPYIGPTILSLTEDRALIFYTLIGAILGLSVFRAMLAVCSTMIEANTRRRVEALWQERIIDQWIDASYELHSSENRAQILNLTAREVPNMGQGAKASIQILSGGIQIALALTFLALVSIEALIGVCIVIGIIMVPISIVVQRNFKMAKDVVEASGSYTRKTHDIIKRIDLIDVFGTSDSEKIGLAEAFKKYLQLRIRMQFLHTLAPFSVQIIMSAILAALLIYFFNLGATEGTLAIVVLFLGGVTIMHPHVDRIGQGLTALTRVTAAYDAIKPIIDLPHRPRERGNGHLKLNMSREVVEVKNLSFAYPTSQGPLSILKNANLSFEKGRLIMLFGATGTGKTTFLRLLQGLLAPDKGNILYGGVDLAKISKRLVGQTVLMMQQDGLTFTGTVRENVAYGQDNLADKDVMKALRMAAADDFVQKLPQGIDTHIGNDGALLSGGQRQRITLARIIAASPPIMLLDEPTSSLDRDVEHKVINSLFRLLNQDHTIIMSTHKVELAPLADTVLWFEGDRIVSGQFQDFQESLTQLIPHEKMRHVLTTSSAS